MVVQLVVSFAFKLIVCVHDLTVQIVVDGLPQAISLYRLNPPYTSTVHAIIFVRNPLIIELNILWSSNFFSLQHLATQWYMRS